MFTKMFGPPPLANNYSYADRTTLRRSCCERRACLEGRDYSRPHSPRDATHILELHYAWWERRMRDNGKEDARQMREDARKRGGGGGGGINDGGRSDGTLWYMYNREMPCCLITHATLFGTPQSKTVSQCMTILVKC